jgi:hypothetical protein
MGLEKSNVKQLGGFTVSTIIFIALGNNCVKLTTHLYLRHLPPGTVCSTKAGHITCEALFDVSQIWGFC